MKETDLAKPVAEWMREKGYKVYAEIPMYGRCIDFVGIKDSEIICVELKVSLTREVRRQAMLCQVVTMNVYVGVGGSPRKDSVESCRKMRLGILAVKDGHAECILEPSFLFEPSGHWACRIIEKCSELGESDDAGRPFQKGAGPAQYVSRLVDKYVNEHPEAGWKEIWQNVPNHYVSHLSLAGAMRMVNQRAHLAECKKAKKAVT